jgi:hypothetical protein
VRVHLAGEHALELEALDVLVQAVGIGLDLADRAEVALAGRQVQQLAGIGKTLGEAVNGADDGFEPGTLPTEFLRAFRVVPDAGLFEFARYFLQALVLVGVIKDTPVRSRYGPRVP